MLIAADEDVEGINCERYLMERCAMRDLVDDPQADSSTLLLQLRKHLDNKTRETDSFVVSMQGTKVVDMADLQEVCILR